MINAVSEGLKRLRERLLDANRTFNFGAYG